MSRRPPLDDEQLEHAVRSAFPPTTTPPEDLAGRIRCAVAREVAAEPVRRRHSYFMRVSMSFATVCVLALMASGRWPLRKPVTDQLDPLIMKPAPETFLMNEFERASGGQRAAPMRFAHQPGLDPETLRGVVRTVPVASLPPTPTSFWRTERPTAASNSEFDTTPEPTTIHITVRDPIESEVRSLFVEHELRDGDLHSEIQFQSRPLLVSSP